MTGSALRPIATAAAAAAATTCMANTPQQHLRQRISLMQIATERTTRDYRFVYLEHIFQLLSVQSR